VVVGITKIRNEEHIIEDTLDNWHEWCDLVHVYDDCSTDRTAEICRAHPIVNEVLTSDCFDPDRERAEWYCRQTIMQSARRFIGPADWIVYFDGDEWLFDFDKEMLSNPDAPPCIACKSFESFITPEDEGYHDFRDREWVGPEWELAHYFYRNQFVDGWHLPDQRHATLRVRMGVPPLNGVVRHWGQGISVQNFERKCNYYTSTFGPKYAEKWEKRKGHAVREGYTSHFGTKLVRWQDVLEGSVETWHRDHTQLVD
jgi:glycosyltransferase involved in cell wall biosynthesis|tara:strand:+ start:542 stop:1309 length:768 start_codon:yes stop_codon:yes gene_type:complete